MRANGFFDTICDIFQKERLTQKMKRLMIFGALAAVAGCATFNEPEQEPNTLSEKEKAEG